MVSGVGNFGIAIKNILTFFEGATSCRGRFLFAEDQGSNAKNQGSTIKHHAIELLEHTHSSSHMITIEISHIVVLNERIPTLQK